jgi:hypothetical protein
LPGADFGDLRERLSDHVAAGSAEQSCRALVPVAHPTLQVADEDGFDRLIKQHRLFADELFVLDAFHLRRRACGEDAHRRPHEAVGAQMVMQEAQGADRTTVAVIEAQAVEHQSDAARKHAG